jgi:hypothetical protein
VSHGSPNARGGPRPPRSRNRIKETEMRRFMRAAKSADVDIESFEVDPESGLMRAVARRSEESTKESELDEWVAKRARPA